MAIGERIHFFRILKGMTQKKLGQLVGFSEKTADIRIAQYESSSRTPKAELTKSLADALGVSPLALAVPNIDSYLGLIHTLFALEDRYGFHIADADGEVCLKVDVCKNKDAAQLYEILCVWKQVSTMLKAGKITREEYDRWRYYYPKYDTSGQWHKITPSQELSDLLLADLKEHSEE
mgnify:FL=1